MDAPEACGRLKTKQRRPIETTLQMYGVNYLRLVGLCVCARARTRMVVLCEMLCCVKWGGGVAICLELKIKKAPVLTPERLR